jgi:hypothetical protein
MIHWVLPYWFSRLIKNNTSEGVRHRSLFIMFMKMDHCSNLRR